MNILFVHQSFPGQYRHLVRNLASQGLHQIVALGIQSLTESIPESVTYIQYGITRGNTNGIHDWLLDIDSKFIRAQSCAQAAVRLRDQGFSPDLICAHPGWGEPLFLKDIWPLSRLLCYQEFYYNSTGFDSDFDPEFQDMLLWQKSSRLRLKNINPLLSLQAADWNVTPTLFQRSSFPKTYHSYISAIHDGIDTQLASPATSPSPLRLTDGHLINPGDPLITFVNRTIEPYRGCHTFLRSVPEILASHKSAHIVIVGSQEGVSYGEICPEGIGWTNFFLEEIRDKYDSSRLHFVGSLSYNHYIKLLQLSACHVYLTYPFVLSWSLLEAMSIGCPVIASSTAPVEEIITDGKNGLLVDFFSASELAAATLSVLNSSSLSHSLGQSARKHIVNHYSLKKCIPSHLSLLQLVASGALSL